MITNKLVILFKATKPDSPSSDKFQALLEQHGFDVRQVNTLNFEFKDPTTLKNCLNCPEDYEGIVFSSPRCVQAVKLALGSKNLDCRWRDKNNYCVGETTWEEASKDLGLECLGKESGNANYLADIMLNAKLNSENNKNYSLPFLYPHGNLKMDILKERLGTSLLLSEVCVYDTIANPKFNEELNLITEEGKMLPEFAVFFSPSGVKCALGYLDKLPANCTKVIAIGPTTESSLKEHGIQIYATAAKPTPLDVLVTMT